MYSNDQSYAIMIYDALTTRALIELSYPPYRFEYVSERLRWLSSSL